MNFFVNYVCECFRFLIEINCLISLFDMRFIRNRVFVMKYSYECIKDFIFIINNRIDWFFRLDVFDMIYDEKILRWKMSKSIYSRWFWIIAFMRFHEISIDFCQLLEIFVKKTFAIIFVRKWYSYETNVNDLNWMLFKISVSWLWIWNEIAFEFSKNVFFSN